MSLDTPGMLGMKKEIAQDKAIAAFVWLLSDDALTGQFWPVARRYAQRCRERRSCIFISRGGIYLAKRCLGG